MLSSSSSKLSRSHRALKLLLPTFQPDPFPIRSSNTFTTSATDTTQSQSQSPQQQQQSQLHILTESFKLALTSSKPLNSNSYLTLAKAFTTKTEHDSVPHLLTFTSQLLNLTKPNPTLIINRLLFAFGQLKQPDTATLLFSHLKHQAFFKPDIYTYNILMEIMGRAGRVGPMLDLFNHIKNQHCESGTLQPDVVSYNTAMNHTRKFGGEVVDMCLGLFEEMCRSGVGPDGVSYGVVIDALGRAGRVEEAMRVFGEMKARGGVRVDGYVYRAVIGNLRKMGKVEMAVELMEEMNGVGNGASWKKRRGEERNELGTDQDCSRSGVETVMN